MAEEINFLKSSQEGGFILIVTALSLLLVSGVLFSVKALMTTVDDDKNTQVTDGKMKKIAIAIAHYRMNNSDTEVTDLVDLTVAPGGATACTFLDEPSSFNASNLTGWCGPYLHPDFSGDPGSYGIDAWSTDMVLTSVDTGVDHDNLTGAPTNLFLPPDLIDFFPFKNIAPAVYAQLIRHRYTLRSCGPNLTCGSSESDDLVISF